MVNWTKAWSLGRPATLKSGFVGMSRWGIKGVEDLGNGYAVGFILEQGFNADSGNESVAGKAFSRESFLYLTGDFGRFGFGRTGTLASGAQSNNILTGWALGTGYGLSSWTSAIGTSFSRVDNAVAYQTPSFGGFKISAMYSNGTTGDDAKWSKNNHYYGVGALYNANAIKSSLIFEAVDHKNTAILKKRPLMSSTTVWNTTLASGHRCLLISGQIRMKARRHICLV
jgi:predicted porin